MKNLTCFLLSYLKYGDHDAIVHCFSEESGYQSFFLRGIYAPKNKKKTYLFPLNKISITFSEKKNSSALSLISQIELAENSRDFNDVKINSILFFVSDFLQQVLREEAHQERIYLAIDEFLEELYLGNFNAYVAFLFKVLSFQGISPLFSDSKFLSPENGDFSNQQTNAFFDEEVSAAWRNYLTSENSYHIKLERNLRRKMIESLMIYYRIHFTNFYQPKSLEIIQQIFE